MFIFELTILSMLSHFKSKKISATTALLTDDNIADANIDSANKFNYEYVSTLLYLCLYVLTIFIR